MLEQSLYNICKLIYCILHLLKYDLINLNDTLKFVVNLIFQSTTPKIKVNFYYNPE